MSSRWKFDGSEAVPAHATFNAQSLCGKSVVVTGGASGIGEAAVRGFVEAGAFVTFGDVALSRGEALAAELGGKRKAVFVKCDVLSWEDQLRLFKTALEGSASSSVDVVVANAGLDGEDTILKRRPLNPDGDPTEPSLRILRTNLLGIVYTARLANFYFLKQPKKDHSLIITASLSSYIDHPYSPEYAASKWGVRGLMRSLRSTGSGVGMRVNMIAPWYIRTNIFPVDMVTLFEASEFAWAELRDAAAAIMHLAGDRSINGRTFCVVPREMSPRGYYDLGDDDFKPGEDVTGWQERCMELMKFVQSRGRTAKGRL